MLKFDLLGNTYYLRGDRLVKSNDPVRRVMHWHKMRIGVSHDPGDQRHGRAITAGYGHIRGSYGDAEDGMAIDVYIGPDLASREVFRVKQINPETGELDEYKYIIGCWVQQEAKRLYLANMPKKFFGGIEPVDIKSLQKYQVR
ncbi:hypothetical protein H6F43_03825 [Leptolyngbya sp. FACHB-36]|uniref:hypothetical protein n=1 Tax=Leptolyngbya sp. FACHB-36 TaxID=2692808 RepID=UPI0016813945|nr:hypothetical protein [Leptolyngbya sp. FACHB-36]MBD2019311.1 hypothetical protein [Leptolyngbya sp. FACHB-36]